MRWMMGILGAGLLLLLIGLSWIAGDEHAPGRAEPDIPLEPATASSPAPRQDTADRHQLSKATDPRLRQIEIHGRCVYASGAGTPAAGLALGVGVAPDIDAYGKVRERDFPQPAQAITDPEGRFSLHCSWPADPPHRRLPLRFEAAEPWALEHPPQVLQTDGDDGTIKLDVGTLRVVAGYRVSGEVIVEGPGPVGTMMVGLGSQAALVREGTFDLGRLPAGEAQPWVCGNASYHVLGPDSIRTGPGQITTELKILVRMHPTVHGRVLDLQDRPIPELGICLVNEQIGFRAPVRTDEQGRFFWSSWDLVPRPHSIEVLAERDRLILEDPAIVYPPYGPEVIVRVAHPSALGDSRVPPRHFGLDVRDARGRPVSDYEVSWRGPDPLVPKEPIRNGRARFSGRLPRTAIIGIQAPGHIDESFEVSTTEEEAEYERVELRELLPLRVEVHFPGSAARRSIRVLYRHGGRATYLGVDDLHEGRSPAIFELKLPRSNLHRVLCASVDAAQRRCLITEAALRTGQVRISFEDRAAPATLQLTVAMEDRDLLTHQRLWIEPEGSGDIARSDQLSLKFDNLRPGRWTVRFDFAGLPEPGTPPRLSSEELCGVTLKAGEHKTIRLDSRPIDQSPLSASVPPQMDGQGVRRVTLLRMMPERLIFVQSMNVIDGELSAPGLPAGRYLLAGELRDPGVTDQRLRFLEPPVVIRAGEFHLQETYPSSLHAHLRLCDPAGQALTNTWFEVPHYGTVRSDGAGEVRLRNLAPVDLQVHWQPLDGTPPRRLEVPRQKLGAELRILRFK